MNTKKLLALLLAACFLVFGVISTVKLITYASLDKAVEENTVYIAVKKYGVIKVKLDPEHAPITVANFKKLVTEGFYDGLTFHRVMESFMIQGGCPKGDGTGDAGTDIKGEFSMNGVDTGLKHVEGTISMARSGHPYEAYHNAGYTNIPYEQREPYYNSASSQFFIVTETSANNTASLDGKYAAFGQVTDGMDVVKAIAAVETDSENDKPLKKVVMRTVTFDPVKAYVSSLPLFIILSVLCAAGAVALLCLDNADTKRANAQKQKPRSASKKAK